MLRYKVSKTLLFLLLLALVLFSSMAAAHRADQDWEQDMLDESMLTDAQKMELQQYRLMMQMREEEQQIWNAKTKREKIKKFIEVYPIEISLLFMFAIALLNFVVGRQVNYSHAQKWLGLVAPLIESNFKLIGTQQDDDMIYYQDGEPVDRQSVEQTDNGVEFEDCTSNEFSLLLSGRDNVIYANLNLVLRKRQDLVSMVRSATIGRFISTQQDALWVEIPIQRTEKVKAEILIIQSRMLTEAKKSQKHIEILMTQIEPNTCSSFTSCQKSKQGPRRLTFMSDKSNLVCLGESQQVVDAFFSDHNVQQFLTDASCLQLIETLHITDQKLYNNFDFVLKVQLKATRRTLDRHPKVLQHLLHMADFLSQRFKVDHKVQQSIADTRKRKYKQAADEEDRKKKKAEASKTAKEKATPAAAKSKPKQK